MGRNYYAEWGQKNPLPLNDGDKVLVYWHQRYGTSVGYFVAPVRKTATQLIVKHPDRSNFTVRFYHDGRLVSRDGTYYRLALNIDEKKAELDAEISAARWERDFQQTWRQVGSGDLTQDEKEELFPILQRVVARKAERRG